jgi:hypothetical protein
LPFLSAIIKRLLLCYFAPLPAPEGVLGAISISLNLPYCPAVAALLGGCGCPIGRLHLPYRAATAPCRAGAKLRKKKMLRKDRGADFGDYKKNKEITTFMPSVP